MKPDDCHFRGADPDKYDLQPAVFEHYYDHRRPYVTVNDASDDLWPAVFELLAVFVAGTLFGGLLIATYIYG